MAVRLGYRNIYRDPQGYPQWRDQGLPVEKTNIVGTGTAPPGSENHRPGMGEGLLWTLLGIFIGGMALNLTPCVYPVIPVTVAYFAGQSEKRQSRIAIHGLSYVLGLALANSTLGVAAALTGGLMGAFLQHPAVLAGIAAVLASMATSLFGFWELRLPYAVTQVAARSHAGYVGSLFMGLTMGGVAAPCIGPFVLGLVTWVAGVGSVWFGGIIFFTLSLGLGLPLFVLALFSGQVRQLPRSGAWMLWVRQVMGWVLMGMAAYYLRALLPETAHTFLLATVALAAGLHSGWLARIQATSNSFQWLRSAVGSAGLVLATLVIGGWMLRGPGGDWKPYSDELLASARRNHRPVIIDFYADWCSPCIAMEKKTFHHPEIVARSRDDFLMVKVNLTRSGNPVLDRLVDTYHVKGVPTVVFIDADGYERKELRVVDFLPADAFLARMDALKAPLDQ